MGQRHSINAKQIILKYNIIGIKEKAKLLLDGRIPFIVRNYPEPGCINPVMFEDVMTCRRKLI
jgi:hypothetical protein